MHGTAGSYINNNSMSLDYVIYRVSIIETGCLDSLGVF